ncbi:hypothetical protein [Fodinibius salsisoli]|uniref:Uncharacterized protein n=1 Tax=Fodinibius salsisoli TaxID=2820877 RepID=A0ABT3PRJ1_9BACT|nr:hypothetical protein [Fodinibius salsisoli]MCW9708489.1 hypothetical protein [Fodinibius salsisoli]
MPQLNTDLSIMEFSFVIGSLKFNAKSIGIILFASLLMGILAGLYSAIHIDTPGISQAITSPILWASAIPIILLVKGIKMGKQIDQTSKE